MNANEIRTYCLSKPGVTEGFPFNESTLVFKVGGKMFLLLDLESQPIVFSAKANPEWSLELREKYAQINGAYHMNKTHWHSVLCDGLRRELLLELINHSYDLVYQSLTKKIKTAIENGDFT